jgi:D-psicose/D-tagatose/L-ribulose 3-epimerase
VSNIAWPPSLQSDILPLLKRQGIKGIEAAPTRLWPNWESVSLETAGRIRETFLADGFQIPALQAILFGKPGLKLFGNDRQRIALEEHLADCAAIAQSLGARFLVFGAPKNRERNGQGSEAAFDMAREFFIQVAKTYEAKGVCLCFEANPSQYGCDFATNSADAARLVRAVNRDGFRLHLDIACMHLAGEEIPSAICDTADILAHFHVSEPFLGGFDSPQLDHSGAAQALREIRYQGWVSLEMRQADSPVGTVGAAVCFVERIYG